MRFKDFVGETPNEFRSYNGTPFGELIEMGFDWGRDEWRIPNYIPAELAYTIRQRVNALIEDTYYWREVGSLPAKFKFFMKKNLSLACSQYGREYLIYAADLEKAGGTTSRGRTVNSQYPQTQLSGDNDYASSADDYENETINTTSDIQQAMAYKEMYDTFGDIDMKLVLSVEKCFRHLL